MGTSSISLLPLSNPDRAPELLVVVIPDFGKDGASTEIPSDWLNSIMLQDGSTVQIIRFHYRINLNGSSVWRELSEKGEDLLKILHRDASKHKLFQTPLILIGYGFGGIIIKRTLSVLSNPSLPPLNKKALDLLAGIIFFGTPHAKKDPPESWARITWLLKNAGKMPKLFLERSELDSSALTSICEGFEQSDIQATVLSVYETKPTKVNEKFWSARSEILVGKKLAMTWATHEKLLANNTSHDKIGTFQPQSAIHQEIGLLMLSALKMRTSVMTESAINTLKQVDPIDMWENTLSHISDSRISPREAQFGSSIPSSIEHVHSQDTVEYTTEEVLPTRPCWEFQPFGHEDEFVGREDIFKIIDSCFFPNTDPESDGNNVQDLTCFTISGLGGMGKTQTAIEYAWSRRKSFDAIFVVQADGAAKLSGSFAGIASKLGLLDPSEKNFKPGEESDLIVSRSKAIKWLSAPKFAPPTSDEDYNSPADRKSRVIPWLLAFDNVEDASLLRDYWPVGGDGCVLVTTRDEMTGHYLRSQVTITLDRLETLYGAKLLLRLSYRPASKTNLEDASAIVERLGGLPIAIKQVATYIYGKSMALKEFLMFYDKSLLERRPSDAGNESWSHTIATSWALDDLSAKAMALIQTFACLYADSIQGSSDTRLMVQPALHGYPEDQDEYLAARLELAKCSLIRFNQETVVVRVHRLVQDIVLARMTDARRLDTLAFVIKALFAAWPTTSHSFEHEVRNWTVQEGLLPHVSNLAKISEKYDFGRLDLSIKRSFVKLLQNSGWYLQERGNFIDGNPLYELGNKLCQTVPDMMLDLRADIAFNLANIASETNQFKICLKHVRDHLRLRLSLDIGKPLASADTGIAYSSLGLGLLLTGDYEEAVKQCDKSIQVYEKRPETLDRSFYPTFPHIHRALALVGAGRPQEAEAGLLGVLQWREEHCGPDDVQSFKFGYVQQCLGLVYARCGRARDSIDAYRKAYENYRETVGTRYHRYGAVCGKIAEYYVSLDQFAAADYLFDEAEEAYSSHPHYVPELARHHFVQSESFRRRGDNTSAQSSRQKAEILYNTYVPLHQRTLLTLETLNNHVAPWVW